jgi:hypothetical protein
MCESSSPIFLFDTGQLLLEDTNRTSRQEPKKMLDILAASFLQGLTHMPLRILHPGILSFLLLVPAAQAQINSAPEEVPNPTAGGGFIRDSRQHPAESSRDNAFSMTINRYGIAATLQTLASQVSATILSKGAIVANAAVASSSL